MKRLTAIGLLCLLSACELNLTDLRQNQPEKVSDFPAEVTKLSGCVHRAAESMGTPHSFLLNARPDKQEFVITATPASEPSIRAEQAALELHFKAQGETTTVLLRDSAIGDHVLSHDLWSIVERCASQLAEQPAANPPAP